MFDFRIKRSSKYIRKNSQYGGEGKEISRLN
ncbi:Protein of unknown function [Bacillus mycoides]|nr:Protein of unknown function [Bacillus mycoides]